MRICVFAAACAVLIAPALWNGFPLLQWDTGGYLARWFEGYLVPSRSTVYGLFVAAGIAFDFWPQIAIQAACVVWIVALACRIYLGASRPLTAFACIVALAATTTLPWIAAVLITDVFVGPSIIALHLLIFERAKLSRRETAMLVAFVAFVAATHNATLALFLFLLSVAAVAWIVRRDAVPGRGIVRGAIAVALGTAMLLAVNFALSGRVAWAPGGYGIVFGRMLQDGIVARYLEDRCPDPRLKLCAHKNALPRNADAFLWGHSVFDQLGRFAGLNDEMRTIVLESLAAYPLLQVKHAVIDTVLQLVSVRSGEGVVSTMWHTYGIIERYTPGVVPAMRKARQQQRDIDFDMLNRVHVPVALLSMALLPVLMLRGAQDRRSSDLGLLALSLTLAILGNAAICGVLSDPHDRYGARIVWIATFAIFLAAIRLVRERRRA
ncbi:MAG: hypothetical protein AB7K04_02405 [Pseudorhodoplanes sp.]